jgi:hypothetical protein
VISARAYGVLSYLHATQSKISAEALSAIFPEGRKSMLSALKELREAGYITTSRQVVNGKYITQSYLGGSPEKELLFQLSQQYSNLNKDVNTVIHYKRIPGASSSEEKAVEIKVDEDWSLGSYEQDPDEIAELRRRDAKNKQESKKAAKTARYEKKFSERKSRTSKDWSASDTAYEFGKRVEGLWHVEQWTGSKQAFVSALHTARVHFDGTGELEEQMINRYFNGMEHKKHLTNPHMIWKMFIREYPVLADEVRITHISDDEMARQKEIAAKEWKKYFNV